MANAQSPFLSRLSDGLDLDTHIQRRARLRAELAKSEGSHAALVASGVPSGHDTFHPNSDVLYLSGFAEPGAVALILPDSHETPFVMFVRERDPEREQWTGRRAGTEGAKERYGADAAHPLSELAEKLGEYLEHVDMAWFSFEDPVLRDTVFSTVKTLRHRRQMPAAGPRQFGDLRMRLAAMRRIKDAGEIEVMRRAAEISVLGHRAAMETIRPGVWEYEVEAAINAAFRAAGGRGPAYSTIVGAGCNATILHYVENTAQIGPHDVVLVDAGADFCHYSGDITRTYPASGRFTPAQRALYEIVLEAEKRAIAAVKPGHHIKQPHEIALRTLTEGLVDLGLLGGDVDTLIEEESYKRFFMHGTSHFLGLDTHDVGEYYLLNGDPVVLEPGMVITIEPGIYVSEDDEEAPEDFRGLGIRIEDDVLVTAAGHEVLTAAMPKEVEEMER